MAKKIARTVTVGDTELGKLIDRGGVVDTDLKNLTVEDKGLKKHISDAAVSALQADELSLKLDGSTFSALVSVTEKYELDASAEKFPTADTAIRAGLFGDAVKVKKVLVVPPDKVEAAFAVLKQMGMNVTLNTDVTIDPDEYRVLTGSTPSSPETKEAIDALQASVHRVTSTRVAYSRK